MTLQASKALLVYGTVISDSAEVSAQILPFLDVLLNQDASTWHGP